MNYAYAGEEKTYPQIWNIIFTYLAEVDNQVSRINYSQENVSFCEIVGSHFGPLLVPVVCQIKESES